MDQLDSWLKKKPEQFSMLYPVHQLKNELKSSFAQSLVIYFVLIVTVRKVNL